MSIFVGSARADENYKYSGGRRGDQRQNSSYDVSGEVSMQPFYVHKKGWYILRPKKISHAKGIAKSMRDACNNKHIGYSQSDRYAIFLNKDTANKDINENINCDCSSLVRKCILDATGIDVGDFNTSNEASVLESSGLFEKRKKYSSGVEIFDGDVLVTQSKGHTVIVVSGNERTAGNSGNKETEKSVSYTIGKKYTICASSLNIRKSPGTSGVIITVLNKGDKYTCKQIKKVNGSVWVSNGTGWICGITNNGEVYLK